MQSRSLHEGGASDGFQVFLPAKLVGQENLPLIIFLHGIGQRGAGGYVPTKGPSGALVRHYLDQVPAIILLPQCRAGKYWSNPEMERMVMRALDQTLSEFKADAARIYLTGVSMGGYGVWHLARHHPGKFAVLVSICGGSPLKSGDRFQPIALKVGRTPAWLFHGADDRIVPVDESRGIVEALKANDGNVRYSEYEGVGHDVWTKALREKELLPWLLAQHLNSVAEE